MPGLLASSYQTDKRALAFKCLTELFISEEKNKELETFGFIPLTHYQHTQFSVFNVMPLVKSLDYFEQANTSPEQILTCSLPYLLSVSRFAHYIKVISREKIGIILSANEFEAYLQDWIIQYVASNDTLSHELKTRFPLREAKIFVKSDASQGDKLQCQVVMSPHLSTAQVVTSIVLKTELQNSKQV